jgi:hypothetical protein
LVGQLVPSPSFVTTQRPVARLQADCLQGFLGCLHPGYFSEQLQVPVRKHLPVLHSLPLLHFAPPLSNAATAS